MCTGDILLCVCVGVCGGGGGWGGNPAIDQHTVQGRVAILLAILHVKETGISSGQGTCKICLL